VSSDALGFDAGTTTTASMSLSASAFMATNASPTAACCATATPGCGSGRCGRSILTTDGSPVCGCDTSRVPRSLPAGLDRRGTSATPRLPTRVFSHTCCWCSCVDHGSCDSTKCHIQVRPATAGSWIWSASPGRSRSLHSPYTSRGDLAAGQAPKLCVTADVDGTKPRGSLPRPPRMCRGVCDSRNNGGFGQPAPVWFVLQKYSNHVHPI